MRGGITSPAKSGTAWVKRQMFPNTYKGTVDHFVKTYEQIWFQFFCKGTTPALVANVGEPSVLSTCYGFCQQVAKRIVGADRKTKLRLVTEACSIFKTRKKKSHNCYLQMWYNGGPCPPSANMLCSMLWNTDFGGGDGVQTQQSRPPVTSGSWNIQDLEHFTKGTKHCSLQKSEKK